MLEYIKPFLMYILVLSCHFKINATVNILMYVSANFLLFAIKCQRWQK